MKEITTGYSLGYSDLNLLSSTIIFLANPIEENLLFTLEFVTYLEGISILGSSFISIGKNFS